VRSETWKEALYCSKVISDAGDSKESPNSAAAEWLGKSRQTSPLQPPLVGFPPCTAVAGGHANRSSMSETKLTAKESLTQLFILCLRDKIPGY
jgi:hypothetical protein